MAPLPPVSALGPGDVADIALFLFVSIFATVAVSAAFGYLRERARLRLAARMLELGQPVPAGLFDRRAATGLVRGVVLLAAAAGLALYFGWSAEPDLARVAVVPGAIGLGYLIGYYLERDPDVDAGRDERA